MEFTFEDGNVFIKDKEYYFNFDTMMGSLRIGQLPDELPEALNEIELNKKQTELLIKFLNKLIEDKLINSKKIK